MQPGSILCPIGGRSTVFFGRPDAPPVACGHLSTELRPYFSRPIRGRGETYFRRGLVRIVRADSSRVESVVKGGLSYRVELSFHGRFARLHCTCAYFSSVALPCKHLWALVLFVDRRPRSLRLLPLPRLGLYLPTPGLESGARPRISALLSFGYGEYVVDHRDPPGSVYFESDNVLVQRRRAAEREARRLLVTLGFRAATRPGDQSDGLSLPAERLADAVAQLLERDWYIEAEGRPVRRAAQASLRISSGIDWFELSGRFDFHGSSAGYPEILRALRRGSNLVRLDDGSLGMLPEEWLRVQRLIVQFGEASATGMRFGLSQAAVVDTLLSEQATLSVDDNFARAQARLAEFESVSPQEPSPKFQGTLREYQKQGLGWLRLLDEAGLGGCLADEMGLGKTVQVLAHLMTRSDGQAASPAPVLIIVPRSILFNWTNEARHFAPTLRVLDHWGSTRTREPGRLASFDIVLTTYGVVRSDVFWMRECLFDCVILDEAQMIKNPGTATAKAARLLRARRKLALTGTPIENSLVDLWSIFEFLNPGMLGSLARFRRTFAGRSQPEDEATRLLARLVRPLILRRTKQEVAAELPARVEQVVYCELSRPERTRYDQLLAHYLEALERAMNRSVPEGRSEERFIMIEALLRLRQAACHAGLLDPSKRNSGSAKIDALVTRLRELGPEGHKALVFSQFVRLLSIVRERLDAERIDYEYLDGSTLDRERPVARFQKDPSCRVFVISLKAGGVGLNLTAADYVFILDPWWNPAAEAQAIDRTHRIGQKQSVFAYRLIARGTVEERVLELQEKKRTLAGSVIGEAGRGAITRDELLFLLGERH
jgi:superfamily II DNA or RNA helicase